MSTMRMPHSVCTISWFASLRLKRAMDQVSLLQNVQEHLVKFVPQSSPIIAANPEAPELEKKNRMCRCSLWILAAMHG